MAEKLDLNPVVNFSSSDELINLALSASKVQEDFFATIPSSIRKLAMSIVELRTQLTTACKEYDYSRLIAKQEVLTLRKEEQDELNRLERERRISKQRLKQAAKLRGVEKKYYKATGEIPEETYNKLLMQFRKELGIK